MAIPFIVPILALGGLLMFAGPRRRDRNWMDESKRRKPDNLSGNPLGYNRDAFTGPLAIKMAFTFLGYDVGVLKMTPEGVSEIINPAIIKQFQQDYNAISSMGVDRLKYQGVRVPTDLGYIAVDGNIDENVLNALEHAIEWVKANAVGGMWQRVAYEAVARGYY